MSYAIEFKSKRRSIESFQFLRLERGTRGSAKPKLEMQQHVRVFVDLEDLIMSYIQGEVLRRSI